MAKTYSVAIDGPAGAGKSTVAKALAKELGYHYVDTRIQLSYGRNRAGYVCSGGVCRYSPEYNGINIAVTASF